MEFTKKERVALINQYRILGKLYPEEASHYEELEEILVEGYEIFYSKVTEWIDDDMPTHKCKLVLDILELYRFIEDYIKVSKDKTAKGHHRSSFMGFDGNNESEYMTFARFLIEKQDKFVEQKANFAKNDHLNSHVPMVETYKRMLGTWNGLGKPYKLNAQQVISILDS